MKNNMSALTALRTAAVLFAVVSMFFVAAPPAHAFCVSYTFLGTVYRVGNTCGGGGGIKSPTASLTATPSTVASGGSSSLSWSSTNATSCSGTNFTTGNTTSGSASVKPTTTTTYTVACSGGGKTATASKTVTVTAPPPPSSPSSGGSGFTGLGTNGMLFFGGFTVSIPIAAVCNTPTLSSDKTTIFKGESATLSWSLSTVILGDVASGPSVSISHVGPVSPTQTANYIASGNVSVSPNQTTSYTATCSVTGGIGGFFTNTKHSDPVTITVLDPVGGSCSASPASIITGESSTWSAVPTGGNGNYAYVWSGTDNLSGTSKSVAKTYASTGTKTASVTITSGGTSAVVSCSNSVAVAHPAVGGSCSASPTSITAGESSTWTAAPTGGNGTYTYLWSGTDSLSGTGKTVSKTYAASGTKSASVTIASGGSSKAVSCSNSISVAVPPSPPTCTFTANPPSIQTGQSATLAWSCSNGEGGGGGITASCMGTGFSTGGATSGSRAVSPTQNTSYGLSCTGPGGSVNKNVSVGIFQPEATLTLTGPDIVEQYTSATLVWSVSQVQQNSCTLSGSNLDSWALSGSSGTNTSSALAEDTTFTLTCTNLSGQTVTTSVTVPVELPFEAS